MPCFLFVPHDPEPTRAGWRCFQQVPRFTQVVSWPGSSFTVSARNCSAADCCAAYPQHPQTTKTITTIFPCRPEKLTDTYASSWPIRQEGGDHSGSGKKVGKPKRTLMPERERDGFLRTFVDIVGLGESRFFFLTGLGFSRVSVRGTVNSHSMKNKIRNAVFLDCFTCVQTEERKATISPCCLQLKGSPLLLRVGGGETVCTLQPHS